MIETVEITGNLSLHPMLLVLVWVAIFAAAMLGILVVKSEGFAKKEKEQLKALMHQVLNERHEEFKALIREVLAERDEEKG